MTNNQIPDSLTGVKVYGDSSCKFTKSDMKLRCNHWATATCVDWKVPEGPAGECCGNDCSDYYKALLGCKWDDWSLGSNSTVCVCGAKFPVRQNAPSLFFTGACLMTRFLLGTSWNHFELRLLVAHSASNPAQGVKLCTYSMV